MNLHTSLRRATVAGVALALTAAVPSAAAPAATPVFVSADGADLISLTLDENDQLSLRFRDAEQVATGADGYDPGDVRLPNGSGHTGAVPAHAAYQFLGEPGTPVWALAPAGSDLATGFPAVDTTGVPAGRLPAGAVDLELAGLDGPGDFHAYTLSPVGIPEVLLGSSPRSPHRTTLPAGERRSGIVWAFDTPGSYQVTLHAAAELDGGATATDQATYQVDVPGFPASEPAPLAGNPTAAELGPQPAQVPQQLPQQDTQTGTGQVVIDDGHIDIGPRFVDGTWTIQVKDDTASPFVWRDLHDVVLHAVEESRIEIPEGEEFGFLGDPGESVWLLPQAQQSGILWPGWNTEDQSVVDSVDGNTTWTLHGVDGPGEFVLFLTGSFGQSEIRFDTQQDLPQSMPIPLRTHAHGNWAFTEPGTYHLTIEMSATTTDGDEVTDTRILGMAVGDVDPSDAFPPAGGGNGNGNGDGNGDGDGDDDAGGSMPKTGFAGLVALVAVGLALLAGGTFLVLVTIRRRRART